MKQSGLVVLLVMVGMASSMIHGPHCLRPVNPRFGGWHSTNDAFSVGTVVTFNCLSAYDLVGSRTAICAISGARAFWIGGTPRCVRHVTTRCLDPGSPRNGRRVLSGTGIGDRVQFSCHVGFKLQGSSVLVCQHGGRWSSAIPRCVTTLHCQDPGIPLNGRRVMRDTNVGSIATFSCNRGYRLIGEASIICRNDGHWSRAKPSCRRFAVNCHSPGIPHNGFSQFQSTTLNAKVTHSCRMGYTLRGASTRICQSNGLWSGNLPVCIPAVDCGQPPSPSNGGVNVDKRSFIATAVYHCKEGFRLSGETQRVCNPDGKWSGSTPSCHILDCGDPGTPRNGEIDLSSTMFRSVVQYSCKSGYNLAGDKVRFCLASGKWSGFLPTCKLINCGDPGTPENGRRTVSSTVFRSAVHYSCNNDFSLVGDEVRICMASGEWSGFLPACKKQVVRCGHPGVPVNGRSEYLDDKVGSIVGHSCVSGFELKGDRLRQCLHNGVWSGSLPTCHPSSPVNIDCGNPGFVANGIIIFTDSSVGAKARIECDRGFWLVGISERICQANGHWSGILPTCEAIDCGDPGIPRNGKRDLIGTTYRDTVVFICDAGFILEGNALRRCQNNGQWSGRVPECIKPVVDCGQLQSIAFGAVGAVSTTEDSVAVYTCENGYQLIGTSVRTCLSSGLWSGIPPVCTIIDCGSPDELEYGFVLVTGTTFDSKAVYTCNPGHILVGDHVRYCEATTVWSGTVPNCLSINCRDPATPANGNRVLTQGTAVGSIVTYECNRGYVLEGAGSRVCQPDGVWSAALPNCNALLCGDPGVPGNGRKTITTHTIGSEVLFTCEPGYSLVGNNVRICQPDQTWSGSIPLCVMINCGDPGVTANAARIFSQTTFNSIVMYTCNTNYMLSGEAMRICQADGTWSGTLPTCEAKELVMCSDPGLPENGKRIVNSNLVTAVVTYSCNLGYFLVGDSQRTCLSTGQWSGDIPSCESINCGDPGKPSNGIVIGNDYKFGATVEYECIDGYVLVGAKTGKCQDDGLWSHETPYCKKSAAIRCEDPGVPDNGRRIGNNLEIGNIIYFQCHDGYELVGERSIVCLPGPVWSARGPFCRIITDTCNGEGIEVFDSCGRKCTCRGGFTTDCCRLRKDWATMSIPDRLQYIDAVIQVSTDPVYKPQYDSLILLYQQLSNSLVHNSDPSVSQFIPWHRYFLMEYENLLRQISCNITIPYWDWTGLPKNPYAADVFDIGSGFGDSVRFNDSCVNIGRFGVNNWVLPAVVGGGCLKRQYQFKTFPTRDVIERDLLPYPASDFVNIHRSLQLVIHNLIRCTIGGTMCTAGDAAAADPLYILHLSRIDSIYSHWQDLKMGRQLVRYADDTSFLTGTDSLTVAELSNNQFLPYRIAVCYDSPFKLKNFQPAKRSTLTA